MDVDPISNVLGLLVATTAIWHSFNPPNPINVSEKEGAVVPSTYERLLRIMFRGLGAYRASLWLAAGIESAVILAGAYPSLTVSKIVLEALLFEGSGSGIRITRARLLGIVLVVLGASLRIWCYRTLGKHFTFVLSMKKDQELVTTGPYSVVRHPSYTGGVMVAIAIVLLYATDGSWMRESGLLRTPLGQLVFVTFILVPEMATVIALARVKEEEEVLQKRYKRQWKDWAIQVPYLLIPGII